MTRRATSLVVACCALWAGATTVAARGRRDAAGRALLPNITDLAEGARLTNAQIRRHGSRCVAESLVHRLERTRREMTGDEPYCLSKARFRRIEFDPRQAEIHLYIQADTVESVLRKGVLNIHQGTKKLQDLPEYAKRRLRADDVMSLLELERSRRPDAPINKLRPKSAVLEMPIQHDATGARITQRSTGGARYGKVVAVLKDRVKRRTTFTASDSLDLLAGGAFRTWSPAERAKRQLRPLVVSGSEKNHYYHDTRGYSEYFEAQVWGEVDLRDVKAFYVAPEYAAAYRGRARPADEKQREMIRAVRALVRSGLPVYAFEEVTQGEPRRNGYDYTYDDYHRRRGRLISAGDPRRRRASMRALWDGSAR